jgi:hypothetical protein
MPKRSSSPLTGLPPALVERIFAERRRVESEVGDPICGEWTGGTKVCPLAKFHSGLHLGER